jgi:hypothetical protein
MILLLHNEMQILFLIERIFIVFDLYPSVSAGSGDPTVVLITRLVKKLRKHTIEVILGLK